MSMDALLKTNQEELESVDEIGHKIAVGCGKASIKWHLNFSSPASNTVNNPTGPAPIIIISVCIKRNNI